MDLDIQVSKLKLLKAGFNNQIYALEDDIANKYPKEINALKKELKVVKKILLFTVYIVLTKIFQCRLITLTTQIKKKQEKLYLMNVKKADLGMMNLSLESIVALN